MAGNACCIVYGDCFIGRAVFKIQEKIPILIDTGVSVHWYINQIRFGIEVKIRKGKLLWIATKVIMGFTLIVATAVSASHAKKEYAKKSMAAS